MIVISFTKAGTKMNRMLCQKMIEYGHECISYAPGRYADAKQEINPLPERLSDWIGTKWGKEAFLFVSAAGIAVRMTAPWVRDKFTDSPVLVMDERAQHVIPLLSGHVGGAVEIAKEVEASIGAKAVITTATDVQGLFAVDVFAKKHNLLITDRVLAKQISAAVLEGKKVGIYGDTEFSYLLKEFKNTDENESFGGIKYCEKREQLARCDLGVEITQFDNGKEHLCLLPRNVVVGIGCRRGTKREDLMEGLSEVLASSHIRKEQIVAITSIDLKKDEEGLVELCQELQVPFLTYSSEELIKTGEVKQKSSFVEKITGVDNVCERAVKYYLMEKQESEAPLLLEKTCMSGKTFAIGRILDEQTEGMEKVQEAISRDDKKDVVSEGILVFAGTTEGRMLAQFLNQCPIPSYVSVATEYGKTCIDEYDHVNILCGRMNEEAIKSLIREKKISLVVDATHPFATEVTKNIRSACENEGAAYLRCIREQNVDHKTIKDQSDQNQILLVSSVEEAASRLNNTNGNILLATGSKELAGYTKINDYQNRCFARVLSVGESMEKAVKLGFEGKHLIAMQGPFSYEMNCALLKQTDARWFVTKESGKTGGFEEKYLAAQQCNATLVVIGRPEEDGLSVEEVFTKIKNAFSLE